MKKIIDCFMFANELDLLEGRLEYLYSTVDYFVIVETNITQNGKHKEFNFMNNMSRYSKYLDKVLYFPFSTDKEKYDFSKKPSSTDYSTGQWKFENDQRNFIVNALKLFDKDDIVLISDLDEIPNKNVIANIELKEKVYSFDQYMFYYNFNQYHPHYWRGTVVTTCSNAIAQTPQVLRDKSIAGLFPCIKDGGWHLSYWLSPEKIASKIDNCAHQELNKLEFKTIENVKRRIKNGLDPFDRVEMVKANREMIPADVVDIFSKYEILIEEEQKMNHYWNTVEGYFDNQDANFYMAVVKNAPSKAHFVEVGSFKGRSSSLMAVEILNSGKDIRFDCVDTWEGSEEHQLGSRSEDKDVVSKTLFQVFTKNMKPVRGLYTPLKMSSLEAAEHYADNSLDFVFIDAAHDYDSVKEDILAWMPKIKLGGILSGHDYPHPPIKRLIGEMFGDLPSIGACWYCVRTE